MKRLMLAIFTLLLLIAAAAMAQNPLNTTAPGPTQEREPGLTNNDLPNPGHPVPPPSTGAQTRPVTENGTVEGTATESMQRDQTGTTTGTTTSTTGVNDTTGSTTSTTTTTGVNDTTGSTTTSTTTTGMNDTTGTSGQVHHRRLPHTGSDMPLVGLIGLASLAGFAVLRASRNA